MPGTLIGAFFRSAELTGTGAAQQVRHDIRGRPQMALIEPTAIGANVAFTSQVGAMTSDSVTVTVPAAIKYRLVAFR